MTRTTISFTRDGMQLIQQAAKRQGCSVSQFVREAALMRAAKATYDSPCLMRTLAEQLRAALGGQGTRWRTRRSGSPKRRLPGSGDAARAPAGRGARAAIRALSQWAEGVA